MSGKIQIWGRKTSSNVQAVMWTVAELGLEHAHFEVGGAFGGTDNPDYRAMNPMGLVPALKDGDLTLFESCAIVRYLGAKYGDDGFWPGDPAKRAELDQWAEWSKTTVAKTVIYEIFWQMIRTPAAKRDLQLVNNAADQLIHLMGIAEKRLGAEDYFGGETLSFADIIFGHVLYRYYTVAFSRPDTPVLDAYYTRLKARPAYADHVMIDYASLKVE